MKFRLSLFTITILLSQIAHSQEKFKKLTIITYDFEGNSPKIDSSVYSFEDARPLTRIESWMYVGNTGLPIQYSEFIADRRPDSLSIDSSSNKIIKSCYNPLKNKWFVYEKRKKNSNTKVVVWLTFYHEFHKMYFTTKTVMKFNINGNLIQTKVHDLYLRKLESKSLYLYE